MTCRFACLALAMLAIAAPLASGHARNSASKMSLHHGAKQHESDRRHASSLAQDSDDDSLDSTEPLSLGEDFADQEDWKAFLNISSSNHRTGKREETTADAVAEDEDSDVDISGDFSQYEDEDKEAVQEVEGNTNLNE